jgi:aminoglycoside N3'-acetyltransferase
MIESESRSEISIDEVTEQLRALGVEEGGVLLVHTRLAMAGE